MSRHFIIVGLLVARVKYWYYPDMEKYFDNQQRIVAVGIANILDETGTDNIDYRGIIKTIEGMYIDSINNGMQDQIDYRPLFVVYDRDNRVLYSSQTQENRCACRLRCCPVPLSTPAPTGILPAAGAKSGSIG